MRAATVVQVLHGLFYVLLQLLIVVAAIILSFKFYCKFYCRFYCSCDPSFTSALQCTWSGITCNSSWFTPVLTDRGNCFAFNAGNVGFILNIAF